MIIMLGGVLIHPVSFCIIYAALLALTLNEFYKLSSFSGFSPYKKSGILTGILLFLICFLSSSSVISPGFVLVGIPLLLVVFVSPLFSKKKEYLKSFAITIGGLIYIALPFSLINFIVFNEVSGIRVFYPWILAGIFFILWTYDSMAYIIGSMFGKHKIAASISPAKSWEGLVGGTVFALIIGILNAVLFQEIDMLNWIIIALLTVSFGTFGDFFESMIKRETGIKDSGNILPGHGGLLDRFDSLLFVVPVIFTWLSIMDKF